MGWSKAYDVQGSDVFWEPFPDEDAYLMVEQISTYSFQIRSSTHKQDPEELQSFLLQDVVLSPMKHIEQLNLV